MTGGTKFFLSFLFGFASGAVITAKIFYDKLEETRQDEIETVKRIRDFYEGDIEVEDENKEANAVESAPKTHTTASYSAYFDKMQDNKKSYKPKTGKTTYRSDLHIVTAEAYAINEEDYDSDLAYMYFPSHDKLVDQNLNEVEDQDDWVGQEWKKYLTEDNDTIYLRNDAKKQYIIIELNLDDFREVLSRSPVH